jgi:serine/threonine-protein kinase HipA
LDLDLARSVAPYFRVTTVDADGIIERQQNIVAQWRIIAQSLKIGAKEQQRFESVFVLAGE